MADVAVPTPAAPRSLTLGLADLQQTETPGAGRSVVAQLRQELQEVKQHRANIVQMQQALSADAALLRESSILQRSAATPRGRTAAQMQLRKTEQIVKDLSAMLRESRMSAMLDAKTMLGQATEVRAAADALAAEASAQLRALAPRSGHRSHHTQQAANKLAEQKPVDQKLVEQIEPVALPAATAPTAQAVSVTDTTEADSLLDTDDGDADEE